ncbi:unnamed protein product [Leptidea sinapis]|uniref:Uncharacterized protein n=1 Tax=Leptidea sinapis TaxID=189913 RepID=A0A5E4PTW7_9NEOP|nr:unnamed protein product [Leptidea sinapis]
MLLAISQEESVNVYQQVKIRSGSNMNLIIPLIFVTIAVIHAKPLDQDFGLEDEPRPVEARHHNHEHARESAKHHHASGASGIQGHEHHNKGRREFHNVGQHHKKSTTVSKSESSESHNIGGSESFDKGDAAGGAFKNFDSNLKDFDKEFEKGQDASIVTK